MIHRWVIGRLNCEVCVCEECFCRYPTASNRCSVASRTDHQGEISTICQRNSETTPSTVKIFYSLLKNRRLSDIKFRSWTEATLDVTVRWLLRQCGRMETESRRKCIELVCTFIPLLPGTYTSQSFSSNRILFSKVFVLLENISI